jgi:hypothetical protein
MTAFLTHVFKPSIQQIVRRALTLRPRGGIPNDVLVLNRLVLSGHCLELEWRARDIHPWDHDLPPARQAELFSKQALEDTDLALIRLFHSLSEIEQIEFQVLKQTVSMTSFSRGWWTAKELSIPNNRYRYE